jgi:hypothetical protein
MARSAITGICALVVLACGSPMHAEDVRLREQAVELMERANGVSLPGALKNYNHAVSFKFCRQDGSVVEGSYTRVSAGAAGFREEVTAGDFHEIIVRSGDRISSTKTGNETPEVRELRQQLPVHLGRFDHEDTIRSIDNANVLGRPAKCVNFDTQFGSTLQQNQLCVDSERDAMLRWRVGDTLIENTEYFQVGPLWEPGRIRLYERGRLHFEAEQRMEVIEGQVDPNVFTPPSSHWNQLTPCKNPRRPVGILMPMPPEGKSGNGIVDVIVHGYIFADGTVQLTQIESSSRPDLNDEALKTVATWKFLPLMCNDRVAGTEADFVVHFQGR